MEIYFGIGTFTAASFILILNAVSEFDGQIFALSFFGGLFIVLAWPVALLICLGQLIRMSLTRST